MTRKGLHYEDVVGKKKAKQWKENIRRAHIGEVFTQERKQKIRLARRKYSKEYYEQKYCVICNKKISHARYKKCQSCTVKARSPETIKKVSEALSKHHIYGHMNDKTMKLTRSKHNQIHHNAYFFILEAYGKKGIDRYLKWFRKKYGLKTRD